MPPEREYYSQEEYNRRFLKILVTSYTTHELWELAISAELKMGNL